jgi:hypothetical protein
VKGICLYSKQVLVADHWLLREFGPYGIIFMNVCVVMTVVMAMLLRNFGHYEIIFMTMCVYCFRFSCHS